MLEYYLPGLDASILNDIQFIQKVAHLKTIREMEGDSTTDKVLKKFFRE